MPTTMMTMRGLFFTIITALVLVVSVFAETVLTKVRKYDNDNNGIDGPSLSPSKAILICEDDKKFKIKGKTCEKYLKKRRKKGCKKWDNKTGRLVKNHCPQTCNHCEDRCIDDSMEKIINKKEKCVDLTYMDAKCDKVYKKNGQKKQVREICRAKCNFCGPFYISDAPSVAPSSSVAPSVTPSSSTAPSSSATPTAAPTNKHFLLQGEKLYGENKDKLISLNGQFILFMQKDGNLVLYGKKEGGIGWEPKWATRTNPLPNAKLVFQPDGNLVLYDENNKARWGSKTHGKGCTLVRIRDDGKLVILRDDDSLCFSLPKQDEE